MKSIEELINKQTKELIEEYNGNSKLNSFLNKNDNCHNIIKQMLSKIEGYHQSDRFEFVYKCNQIERDLIEYIHSNFHGTTCIIKDRDNNSINGIIKNEKTRIFENRTLDNTISFRRRFENEDYSEPETIALWVITDDNFSTHLYPISQIFI